MTHLNKYKLNLSVFFLFGNPLAKVYTSKRSLNFKKYIFVKYNRKQQNFDFRFMFKRKYPFYLTLCAIAKNEGRYLQEWIEYHKMLGVEKFFIYDNESADNTRVILQPYIDTNLVEYCYFPGKKMQLKAYANCVRKHKRHTKYLGFLDIDEFIVPIKHITIPDYLRSLGRFSGVQINWLVYGSGGAKKREKGSSIGDIMRISQFGRQ